MEQGREKQKDKGVSGYEKNKGLATDGYFACSVGNVSEEMIKKYIENQG